MERLAKFSDEVIEGQSSVRVEEECVERCWLDREQLTEVGGLIIIIRIIIRRFI